MEELGGLGHAMEEAADGLAWDRAADLRTHLDSALARAGGFLETKRIADMAHVYAMPIANHNTGSQVNTYASAQWAASIHDYIEQAALTRLVAWYSLYESAHVWRTE